MAAASAATTKTLRPCAAESVGRDGTPGGFDSENLYIEGDNLEVLKLLQTSYAGKVKMIYIDPPYNTGHDFVYRDRFSLTQKELDDNAGGVKLERHLGVGAHGVGEMAAGPAERDAWGDDLDFRGLRHVVVVGVARDYHRA